MNWIVRLGLLVGVGALAPSDAFAYVGPGAGITLVGAIWAVVAAVFLALAGVLLWPIRALLRKLRQGRKK